VLAVALLWPGGASSQTTEKSHASETTRPTPIALAEGAARRLTVAPGTPVAFTLTPGASFLDAAIMFEGAEVMATLRRGDVTLMTARMPERSRGTLPI
jgi:hypothetical protein